MANDPLALSGITTWPPHEAEYDAVYAAVTATERGRWFLTEYANRNRHADTDLLVAALARLEVAIGEDSTPPSELAVVVERIQDIAFGLRERAADPTLCDALDNAAREICETLAKGRPAAVEAADFVSGPVVSKPPASKAADNARRWYIESPDFVFHRPDRKANNIEAESIGQPAPAHPLPVGVQLPPGPEDDPADLFEPLPSCGVAPEVRSPAEEASPPLLRIANGAAPHAVVRPALGESLAGLRDLSEEELVALFG